VDDCQAHASHELTSLREAIQEAGDFVVSGDFTDHVVYIQTGAWTH
jgi:hypothetical protein